MKNNKELAEGRKNFMKLGLLSVVAFIAGKGFSGIFRAKGSKPSGEKLKMLTADGKLVEVDRAFIKKSKKASKNDIMNWVHKGNA